MDEKILKDRIEQFFNTELTVEEERELCRYLRDNEVSTELRKDKEAIIALCTPPEEVELPEGAAERLEAMLDGLEEMKTHPNPLRATLVTPPPYGHPLYKQRGSLGMPHSRKPRSFVTLRMTSVFLRAACVAGVAVALFLALPSIPPLFIEGVPRRGGGVPSEARRSLAKPLLTEAYEEEDTFDNPEEAMQCLLAAYSDIQYAMNTARDNTHEVYRTLEQSVKTNLNVLKIETIKAKEL